MPPMLSSLLKTVSRTVSLPTPQPVPQGQTTGSPPVPGLQGDIALVAVEDVFHLIHFAGLSGKLEVQTATNCGVFFFRKGVLVHGLLQMNQRKIGQILLDARAITEQQLEECLALHRQAKTQTRFGQILVEKGYVEAEWLNKSLIRQIKEGFYEILSWHAGHFAFFPGQVPEAPDQVQMYVRIDQLLLEGMIHIDETSAAEALADPKPIPDE